jgi:hypothetical protein
MRRARRIALDAVLPRRAPQRRRDLALGLIVRAPDRARGQASLSRLLRVSKVFICHVSKADHRQAGRRDPASEVVVTEEKLPQATTAGAFIALRQNHPFTCNRLQAKSVYAFVVDEQMTDTEKTFERRYWGHAIGNLTLRQLVNDAGDSAKLSGRRRFTRKNVVAMPVTVCDCCHSLNLAGYCSGQPKKSQIRAASTPRR